MGLRVQRLPRRRSWFSTRLPVSVPMRKKPSDDCMSHSAHTAAHAFEAEHLPVWWRCVLVALATVILCSCSSPMTRTAMGAERTALAADKTLNDATQGSSAAKESATVVIQD